MQMTIEIIGVMEAVKKKYKTKKKNRAMDTKNVTLWVLVPMIRGVAGITVPKEN